MNIEVTQLKDNPQEARAIILVQFHKFGGKSEMMTSWMASEVSPAMVWCCNIKSLNPP
jgi:hypothetical protein